jgi:ABC-2 type transport system permease protein
MPAQVAEEKEKKLLLALLQAPIREIEWLIAKLFLGMILILIAVLSLHLLGRFKIENTMSYAAFIVVGSFCFSSYGIFLGFLCRNSASARALGSNIDFCAAHCVHTDPRSCSRQSLLWPPPVSRA